MGALRRQAEVWHLIVSVAVSIFLAGGAWSTLYTTVERNSEQIEVNSSMLRQGHRFTREDHNLYRAEVDTRFDKVDRKFELQWQAFQSSNNQIIQRLDSMEQFLRGSNHGRVQ